MSERLLNMSIKFYTSQKIYTPPPKKNKFLATPLTCTWVYVRVRAVCRQPVDLALVVDTSTSIGRVNMVRMFEYAQSLMLGLHSRSRVAVVTFSDRPRLVQNFTDAVNYRTLDSLSAAYTTAPSTDTAGALRLACELLNSSPVHQRRVALLIVDGRYGWNCFVKLFYTYNNQWNSLALLESPSVIESHLNVA